MEHNLGPYNEGVELILTCSVSGGEFYIYIYIHLLGIKTFFPTRCRKTRAQNQYKKHTFYTQKF